MKKINLALLAWSGLVLTFTLTLTLASCSKKDTRSEADAVMDALKAVESMVGAMDALKDAGVPAAAPPAAPPASAPSSGAAGASFSWPANSVLAKYGASGMPLPTGASVFYYNEAALGSGEMLSIGFNAYTAATFTSINNWLTSNGWTLITNTDYVKAWLNEGTMVSASYTEHDTGQATFGFTQLR